MLPSSRLFGRTIREDLFSSSLLYSTRSLQPEKVAALYVEEGFKDMVLAEFHIEEVTVKAAARTRSGT